MISLNFWPSGVYFLEIKAPENTRGPHRQTETDVVSLPIKSKPSGVNSSLGPCRHRTYEILAQTLHLHWRVLGGLTRQSLQTRSWHSSQRSPRSKMRPSAFRQRAHCRSPRSWGRWEPFRLISSSSFFSFLQHRTRITSAVINKTQCEMCTSSNDDSEVPTVSSSPLVSSISRPSAAPSGSSLVHVPAERRGSDPPRPAPSVLSVCARPTNSAKQRTTLCCALLFSLWSSANGLVVVL